MENKHFFEDYNLTSERQKDIILKLQVEDFCHSLNNIKVGYEHEILYVFSPKVNLFNFNGDEETLDLYIKFNLINKKNGSFVVVISLHKRNKPITYCF